MMRHWCKKCGRKKLELIGNPRGKHKYYCPICEISYHPLDCVVTTTELVLMKRKQKKQSCRCYINLKYYAKVARTGKGTFKGYKPCPVHEKD